MSGKKGTSRATSSTTADYLAHPKKFDRDFKAFSKAHQDGDHQYTRHYLLALGLSRAVALVRYSKKGSAKPSRKAAKKAS